MVLDFEQCYRAVCSRDARFDGWFFIAVATTGIYCRPSCPAVTPKRANVAFYPSAAAAQGAGFRACRRCRPDAAPGSPEWNTRADLVARAMRLIGDGVVDRDGVDGLARRLHLSPRHLHRQLVAELGAGPLALARAQRAQTARLLIETTDLPFAHVAFAAGFASIRQFNDTVRAVFAATPSRLRATAPRHRNGAAPVAGTITLRLPYRAPMDVGSALTFLAARAVPGVEHADAGSYTRALRLPRANGIVELSAGDGHVRCVLRLDDFRDVAAAVYRCRALLDLDADPIAVSEQLGADALLAPLVRRRPGLRVPGTVDGTELALRAVLGQQVSVAGARTIAGRLAEAYGEPVKDDTGRVTVAFPTPEALAEARDADLPMPAARAAALRALAAALASGELAIDAALPREELERRLCEKRGIGPWTAAYVALRALRDPDVFLAGDLGVRRALAALGAPARPSEAAAFAARWRPWRSYALQHLWQSLEPEVAA